MAYDLHIVRTKNWLEASSAPISKQDVDALIASDPELTWSTADYVDMRDDAGAVTRYYMIIWRGQPCAWMTTVAPTREGGTAKPYLLWDAVVAR